jgi:2,4-dienoyl-CoA reductase-like NADH-dependent reductase (Old Yellow Enzyme family)
MCAKRLNDPLLEPFDLKRLRLRNRIVSTSHEPAYSEDGMPKERYRLYHREKARGGIGLTMVGGSAIVAPDSAPSFGNLHLYKDEVVPWLRELADDVHAEGAAVMCQITHLGRRTSNYAGDWLPALAPSRLKERTHRAFPKAAEPWDIARVAGAYASAAGRVKAAGLDGLELEAYGHLLDAFWSPATNLRTDEWGGSLENRLRFPRRVISAIRGEVGEDFIVGIRMAVDERRADGVSLSEGLEIAKTLVGEGLDFISVVVGHIDSDLALSRVIPGMGMPSAPYLSVAAEVKRALTVPVMHAARIADVATARYAVREGLVDLVGMTRAHIADPHIVVKIQRGEEDRIRPCVGANYCLDAIYQGTGARCIHNPATGQEAELAHSITPNLSTRGHKAVVVGAGPAGLEAARVLAERGYEVVLLEAANEPGGQLSLATRLDRRRDLIGIVQWRVDECERNKVDLRLNVYAETDIVRAERPSLVVVATGGLPDTSFLRHGAEHVNDTWEIMGGTVPVRAAMRLLIYDDNGAHPALDAAEFAARAGARVHYVTPERTFAPDVGGMNYPAYLEAFGQHGVTITLNRELIGIQRMADGRLAATFLDPYSGTQIDEVYDQVVVEHGTVPNDELYFDLIDGSVNGGEIDYDALLRGKPQPDRGECAGRYAVFRVGDAVTSRNVHAAILDSFRLCATL